MTTSDLLRRGAAALLLALPAAAQTTTSYHGVSHQVHQDAFDVLAPQGYRMISLTVSGSLSNAAYSAVWRQVGGPGWVSSHGMSHLQYGIQAMQWTQQGFRPKLVAASGTNGDAVFAAVWVNDGVPAVHAFDLATSSFDATVTSQRNQGNRLVSCAPYVYGNVNRHIAVFEPDASGIAWGAAAHDTEADFGHKFNEFALGHARPNLLAVSEGNRYTQVWSDDRVGAWNAVVGRTWSQFQSDKTQNQNQGLVLTQIAATGTGASARYSGIFQERLTPYSRSFTRTGQAVPEMAGFDTYVETFMQSNRIRNASLAVARHGRLIYARGYTWAEPGSFVTQPTTPFRLGSISKALCGTLAQELIARNVGGFDMDTKLVDYLGIGTYASGAQNVSVRQLIQHTSGMTNDISESAARQWWIDTQNPSILFMPLDERIIVRYAVTRPFTAAGQWVYSNPGNTALGQIIEVATGQDYTAALRDRLFATVGTTALYQQKPRPQNHAPGEVPYFLPGVTLEPSNIFSDYRLLSNQYAREYWDSAGGAVSSALVLARVISGAFCIGDQSPSLLPAARAAALAQTTPAHHVTDGSWYRTHLGGGRYRYEHNGATDGFGAQCVFTSDGLAIVLLTNMSSAIGSASTLVARADQVANWPTHDLFPNYGMAAFGYSPPIGTAQCFGDGSGGACPCGNTGGAGRGCRNQAFSAGAKLEATGIASVSADSVVLRASGTTPTQTGLFFQGTTAVNAGQGAPFGDGLLCVGGSIVRLQVRNASLFGTALSSVSLAAEGGLAAGQTRRYQWWYRDTVSSPCGSAFNLSNSLSLTWGP